MSAERSRRGPCRFCTGYYEQHEESPTPMVVTVRGVRHEEGCPNA